MQNNLCECTSYINYLTGVCLVGESQGLDTGHDTQVK